MNGLRRRARIVLVVVVAVAAGLIAYGSCIGANISVG
jgi:hypothetical protein